MAFARQQHVYKHVVVIIIKVVDHNDVINDNARITVANDDVDDECGRFCWRREIARRRTGY